MVATILGYGGAGVRAALRLATVMVMMMLVAGE